MLLAELLFYNFSMGPVSTLKPPHAAVLAILFAKAPISGRVKTRLAAAIGFERAAALHRAFTADMIEKLLPLAPLELHIDIETDEWREFEVTRRLQGPGDLGARMLHAIAGASPIPAIKRIKV